MATQLTVVVGLCAVILRTAPVPTRNTRNEWLAGPFTKNKRENLVAKNLYIDFPSRLPGFRPEVDPPQGLPKAVVCPPFLRNGMISGNRGWLHLFASTCDQM